LGIQHPAKTCSKVDELVGQRTSKVVATQVEQGEIGEQRELSRHSASETEKAQIKHT
jgi:hypothetical protein